jgi:catechol 2,3-dioxygenase-like lactoylglutathione lyase family enzyme
MQGIAHMCFTVSDLDKSIEFYRDKMGFRQAFDLNLNDGKVRGVYFHVGGRTFLELFEGEPRPDGGNGSFSHFCIEVADIEKMVSALRGRGVEVSDPKMGQDGSYQAWVRDPDGNRIELHQYTSQSLQARALAEDEAEDVDPEA